MYKLCQCRVLALWHIRRHRPSQAIDPFYDSENNIAYTFIQYFSSFFFQNSLHLLRPKHHLKRNVSSDKICYLVQNKIIPPPLRNNSMLEGWKSQYCRSDLDISVYLLDKMKTSPCWASDLSICQWGISSRNMEKCIVIMSGYLVWNKRALVWWKWCSWYWMVDMMFRGDMVDIVSLFDWCNIVISCPTRLSSRFQHPENRGISHSASNIDHFLQPWW